MHAHPLPAKEGVEDGGSEFYLAERPPTKRFRFAIEGAEHTDFFHQPEFSAEEIAEAAVRPENVIGSYDWRKANHRVGGTNYATRKAYPHLSTRGG